jgi:hypothetical protein
MKFIFSLLFVFIISFSIAQDSLTIVPKVNKRSLGTANWGIGLGNNPSTYSGLKFNFYNENIKTNGICFNILTDHDYKDKCKTNGINIGLAFLNQTHLNGIGFSALWLEVDKMNGIVLSGLIGDFENLNGIGISGLVNTSSNVINGLSIAGLDITGNCVNGVMSSGLVCIVDSTLNGFAISGIFSKAETNNGVLASLVTRSKATHGIQIGLVNSTDLLQGIQFGLINIVKQNPRWCRVMPVLNFHIKKYVPRIDSIISDENIIVKKYRIDNRTLKSIESRSYKNDTTIDKSGLLNGENISYNKKGEILKYENYKNGLCHGHTIIYDEKRRLIEDSYYSYDTIISTRKTTYFSKDYYKIYYYHDSVTETISIVNGDTSETTRLCNGIEIVTTKQQYNILGNAIIYCIKKNNEYISSSTIYTGKNVIAEHPILGKIKLINGDTLSEYMPFKCYYSFGDGLYFNDEQPYYKNSFGLYISMKGKLKGVVYENSDSCIVTQTTYYDFEKKRISHRSIYSKEHQTDTAYFKDGKIRSIELDWNTTCFNKKGRVIKTIESDPYSEKEYHKGKLIAIKSGNYECTFYKNGNIKHEYVGSIYDSYIEKYYRKDGSLKEERCFGEGTTYLYDKKGQSIFKNLKKRAKKEIF